MNYYNENDTKACEWLRELIKDGLIPKGEVDDRSITDVQPGDLAGFTQCHFFAGISGWPYALRLAGWPDDKAAWTGSCPCQPFSCAGKGIGTADERHLWPAFFRLIEAHKPQIIFGEQVASAEVLGTDTEAAFVDAVQRGDCARANKLAHALARSSSFHFSRRWLDGIQDDLEGAGYVFGSPDLPAASVGAPHIRQRLYWVANAASPRQQPPRQGPEGQARNEAWVRGSERGCDAGRMANADNQGFSERERLGRIQPEAVGAPEGQAVERGGNAFWSDAIWHQCRDGKARRIPCPQPGILSLADGLPEGVDLGWLESSFPLASKIEGRVGLLRGYGNAICARLASEFIRAAIEAIRQNA